MDFLNRLDMKCHFAAQRSIFTTLGEHIKIVFSGRLATKHRLPQKAGSLDYDSFVKSCPTPTKFKINFHVLVLSKPLAYAN